MSINNVGGSGGYSAIRAYTQSKIAKAEGAVQADAAAIKQAADKIDVGTAAPNARKMAESRQSITAAMSEVSAQEVAGAALSQAADVLGQMSTVATAASDPTLNSGDRAVMNSQMKQLNGSLADIKKMATYDGGSTVSGQVRPSGLKDANMDSITQPLQGADVSTLAGAQKAQGQVADAQANLSSERTQVGTNTKILSAKVAVAETNMASALDKGSRGSLNQIEGLARIQKATHAEMNRSIVISNSTRANLLK